ncbi:pregnancy-specific glycoprotein 22-like isoform X2 [Peromyscus maniculatus bairdii]|uniref:pregnancy-specific glycoprotein 22-like isoform X2 n=1 Tax=Peromyscus maniculatus bairdii TaxID=230844 RepID=UPI003FD57960
MEVSSMIPCKGCTPWQGLLFTASILTCWHLSTTDRFAVQTVPLYVANGDSILFLVRNLPKNLLSFAWIKGKTSMNDAIIVYVPNINLTVPGRFHSGRETVYGNGSLLIQNVNQKDTGFYSLLAFHRRTDTVSQIGTYLYVNTSLSVFCNPLTASPLMIQPVPRYPSEGESVLFEVHNLPEDVEAFYWYIGLNPRIVQYFRSRNSVSWFPTYRKRGWMLYNNGSLMLRGITVKDNGKYTLLFSTKHHEIEKAEVELHVNKSVTQPFVRITDTVIAGQRSVTFSCISRDTDISIRWIFNNQNLKLTESMTLSPTKCGLRIDSAKRENAGEYKCEVSNRFSSKTSPPVFWP